MLGVGIHIHFRRGVEIQVESLHGNHLIRIDRDGDSSITIFPGIDGLRRLHEATGAYLAEHDAPAAPPIPADAATDDAESLPPGWRPNDCGYKHICGDWVDTTDGSGKAVAHRAGGGACFGFASARDAMDVLDGLRDPSDDDTGEFDTRDILATMPTEGEIRTGRINAPEQVP